MRLPVWLKIAIPAGLLVAVGVLLWVVPFSNPNTLSEKDLTDIDTVCLRMEELRDSDEYINSDEEAKAKMALAAIDALADQTLVDRRSIFYDEENGVITYTLSCGILACEMVGGFEKGVFQNGSAATPFETQNSLAIGSSSESFANAIILNAATDIEGEAEYCMYLRDEWTSRGLATEMNKDVTLDDFLTLSDYEFVFVVMHGTYYRYSYVSWLVWTKTVTTPIILLEEKVTIEETWKYAKDLMAHRIGMWNGCYYICPEFVRDHYKNGDFSESIIFFSCCQLMGKNDIIAEDWTAVLQEKSIAAFVGAHNSIWNLYVHDLIEVFVDNLIEGETVKVAFDNMIAECGETDARYGAHENGGEPAYPLLRGNPAATLKGADGKKGEDEQKSPGEIVEKTEYATIYRITHTKYDGEQLVVDMYYDLAVLNGSDAVTKKMNQQLYADYEEWVDSFSFYEECWKDAINLPVYDKQEAHFQYCDSSIISILHHTVGGIGGNSIITGTYGHTFSRQTGEELQLKDLFPANEATLSKLILQRWNKYVGQETKNVSLDMWEFYVGSKGELIVWQRLYNNGSPDVPTGIYVGQPLPTPEPEPEKVVLSEEDKDQIWKAICFWEYGMDGRTTIYNVFGWDNENVIPVETGVINPIKGNPSTEQIYAEIRKDARQYLVESKVEEAVRLTEHYVRTVNGIVYYQGTKYRGDPEIVKDSLQYSYGDGKYYVSYNYWQKKATPDETVIFVRENGVLHVAGRK